LQLTIEKLVYGGDGLARLPADEHGPGKAVFVPFVLESEKIDAVLLEHKRSFARGQVKSILQPSTERIDPHCPYFQRCGGCHYQHTDYEHQLQIKAAILRENLRRIAKVELELEITIVPSPPWNYRNRSRLRVRTTPEFALGYYRFGSHELLPVEQCPVSSPLINRGIAEFWKMGRAGNVPAGIHEVEFFANAEDSQLLVEANCEPETSSTLIREWADGVHGLLPEIAGIVVFKVPSSKTTISAEPKQIAQSGAREIIYNTETASYRVAAGAFFQVNRHLVSELARIVTEGHAGNAALDLYAGVGLFSTLLAQKFPQVIAVESSQTAHASLVYNSPSNVKAVNSTTANFLGATDGGSQLDLVVVDPPRSGLGESVVRSIVGLGAHNLTYISCDPATASRDLAGLLGSGYRIERLHLVDLFPQTYHLESVFHLVR
jgi:23S rRNA (uracil1939-C5)-methyltransferase